MCERDVPVASLFIIPSKYGGFDPDDHTDIRSDIYPDRHADVQVDIHVDKDLGQETGIRSECPAHKWRFMKGRIFTGIHAD